MKFIFQRVDFLFKILDFGLLNAKQHLQDEAENYDLQETQKVGEHLCNGFKHTSSSYTSLPWVSGDSAVSPLKQERIRLISAVSRLFNSCWKHQLQHMDRNGLSRSCACVCAFRPGCERSVPGFLSDTAWGPGAQPQVPGPGERSPGISESTALTAPPTPSGWTAAPPYIITKAKLDFSLMFCKHNCIFPSQIVVEQDATEEFSLQQHMHFLLHHLIY